MKRNNLHMFSVFLTLVLFLGLLSCEKEKNTDTTPPGQLTIIDVISTNGGAKIVYELPADDDVLFVKAKYTNSLGNEVFKSTSFYSDTIELDGFNDTLSHKVELFAVDHANNHSPAVETNVTPLISYIYLVQESIVITPDLGGVKIEWQNISEKTVHVYLTIKNSEVADSGIISSSLRNYTTYIRGLDSINYDFYTKVEDFPGNKTPLEYTTTVKPKFEQKIDKSVWSLVSNLSVDGNAHEGVTENFWDDIIDTKESAEDNSYFIILRDNNGGALSYPMDIVIDLNKQVVVNRFTVWQRDFDYQGRASDIDHSSKTSYYYQSENLRIFDIYISNDLDTWTLVGTYDIGDPKNDDGEVPPDYLAEAREGHMFMLEQTTTPFRYLKFSITSNFGSEQYIYGSEISLYGLDNVQ